jgi:hypothetical protein
LKNWMRSMLRTLAKKQLPLLCTLLVVSAAAGQQVEKQTEEPAPMPGCESQEVKGGKEKGAMGRFFPAPMVKVKEATVKALSLKPRRGIQRGGRRYLSELFGTKTEEISCRRTRLDSETALL